MQSQTYTPWFNHNSAWVGPYEADLEALELARLEGESPACGWEDATEIWTSPVFCEVSSWENEGGSLD